MTQRLGWIAAEIEIENLLIDGYAELATILADNATADPFLEPTPFEQLLNGS